MKSSILIFGIVFMAGGARSPQRGGVATESAEPYRAESTRRMAGRLERLARQYQRSQGTGQQRFFTANAPWKIPVYREQLRTADDPQIILNLRFRLGRELLWDGQSEQALSEFDALAKAVADLANDPSFSRLQTEVDWWRAVSYLRIGEQRNCCSQHSAASCILPIQGSGTHTDKYGSRGAIHILTDMLQRNGMNLSARWLLNIAHMTLGTYPDAVPDRWLIPPHVFDADYDIGRFVDVAIDTGTDIVGLAGGSVLEDFNGDGFLDIMASSWGFLDQVHYLKSNGDGTFTDRTKEAGLLGVVGGLNMNHADYNNDGYPDVLVIRGGWLGSAGALPNSLLRNNGDGTFDDVTVEAGLLWHAPGQVAAWADYNNDGFLDVFMGNEMQPCHLFRNNGDGTFTDRAALLGLADLGIVKGAAWGDYDNNGTPDLYVSRLSQPNLLFCNDGKGKQDAVPPWLFQEVGQAAGVTEPHFSFPTWFWDYDNDGWLDIFAGPWDAATAGDVAAGYLGTGEGKEHPRLFHNEQDGTFHDVTHAMKLDRVLLAMGANFGDLDNDGFEDVYLGTGAPDYALLMPNRMFRNAAGLTFQDVTTSGGFGHLQKGHGISFGDIDNDGDQDIYAVMGGWYTGDGFANVLFENPGHGNHWITLRLRGVQSNRMAVGVRIDVTIRTATGERHIHRAVGTGGSFGSSSLQQEIGLGQAESIDNVRIDWPASGKTQVFSNVPMDRVIAIREDSDRFLPVDAKRFSLSKQKAR